MTMKKMSIVLLALLVSAGLFGCMAVHVDERPAYVAKEPGPPPWAPAHGYRAKHRYYYYPDALVYYDMDRKVYFYPSGGEWRMSAALPPAIRLDVRSYTLLEMDADRPYVHHSQVTQKYPPGQLKKLEKDKDKDKDKGKGKGKKWD